MAKGLRLGALRQGCVIGAAAAEDSRAPAESSVVLRLGTARVRRGPEGCGGDIGRHAGIVTIGSERLALVLGGFEGFPEAGAGDQADGAVGLVARDDGEAPDIVGGKALEDGEEVFVGEGGWHVGGH